MAIFIPIYVPKKEIEHAEEVYDKTKKAYDKYAKWWKLKLCACGCGLKTVNTYVNGHHTKKFRHLVHDKLRRRNECIIDLPDIKRARLEAGLRQKDIADYLGCTRRLIGYFEVNKRIPTPEQQIKLKELLPSLKSPPKKL